LREKLLSSSSIFFFTKTITSNFEQTKFKFKLAPNVSSVLPSAHFLMSDFKINKIDNFLTVTSLITQIRLSLLSTLFANPPSSFVIKIDDLDKTLLSSAFLEIDRQIMASDTTDLTPPSP